MNISVTYIREQIHLYILQGTRKKLRTNKASVRSYAPASLAGDIGDARSDLGDSYSAAYQVREGGNESTVSVVERNKIPTEVVLYS